MRSEKETIEQSFTIPADLKSLELAAHATALRMAVFLDLLTLISRSKANSAPAIEIWKTKGMKRRVGYKHFQTGRPQRRNFLRMNKARPALGFISRYRYGFCGSSAEVFYEEIDRRLSGNTNRSLRRFLKEGGSGCLAFHSRSSRQAGMGTFLI
ncbi:MAG: hypothetical protein R3C40_05740 [Parvularculaceae bacterium]